MPVVVSTYARPRLSGGGMIAAARLDCGHENICDLKPTVYACGGCGKEALACTRCSCGYTGGFRFVFIADANRADDRLTKAGDVIACHTCESHAKDADRLRALTEPVFHARYSERWGGQYHLYRRDRTSPSGVMLITSVAATPEIDAILRERRISPLSPTEGRETL